MSTLTIHSETPRALLRPEPRSPIAIRVAVAGGASDFKFIDDLQKKHSRMVGFLRTKDIEKYIANGWVLIAEDQVSQQPIGYIIFKDKYLKREELGIVFQLNIAPHKQRGLVGAALVQTAFERSAYGCKLFCCWCAQDIEANRFWESIGFVPLAFRAGTRGQAQGGRRKEGRIHIFWQKRIREGDDGPPTGTPYWYPSETSGGAMKENRIVLPIPPGMHWSDAKPMVLPGAPAAESGAALPEGEERGWKPKRKARDSKPNPKFVQPPKPNLIRSGGLRFVPGAAVPPPAAATKAPKPKRQKQKNDPKLVAAARELRDRYLEEVNSGRALPAAWGSGKYDVSRQLASQAGEPPTVAALPLLDAA